MRNPFHQSIWSQFMDIIKGVRNTSEREMVKKVKKEIGRKNRKKV